MKLILNNGQEVFFTSDTHYNHANICAATTVWDKDGCRLFTSLEEMNTTLVDNINSMVGEDDILFHLGDWSFGGKDKIKEFRDRIKCKNIHLILGNHDEHIERNRNNEQSLFASVHDYLFLTVVENPGTSEKSSTSIVLMHYPICSWNGMRNGVFHLHGHVHLTWDKKLGQGRSLDVGVDGYDYFPYDFQIIKDGLKIRPIRNLQINLDHHEKHT